MRTLDLPDQTATESLAARLAPLLRPGDAVLLSGDLGAGKSTFARALLRALAQNPTLEVPSPTYTLQQTYATPRAVVHHFDLWRLGNPAELAELGWEEAMRDIILVEWPERLEHFTPAGALHVHFTIIGEHARRAVLSGGVEEKGLLF
jgi:tRNA threonylcarbamoyladenosine biosynthesis protein TsaE